MGRLIVDTHFHGPESDGALTKEEIIKEFNILKRKNNLFIAATDHDIIDQNLLDLLENNEIPHCEGVEISTFFEPKNGEKKYLHLTAYAKHFSGDIMDILQNNMDGKTQKIEEQCKLLKDKRFDINYDEFKEYFRKKGFNIGNLNIAHIANYIFLNNENKKRILEIAKSNLNENEFLDSFLKSNGKHSEYGTVKIPEYLCNVEEIGDICNRDGYLLSIPHPNITFNQDKIETLLFIKEYLDYIKGIEINSQAPESCVKVLKQISRKNGLILTFGSDSHGTESNDERGQLGDVNKNISQKILNDNLIRFKEYIGIK